MRIASTTIVLSVLVAAASATAADAPAKQPDEPAAIRKGLAYVEAKSLAWLRQRKCASCHHVPLMVWAQRDARQRGFKIDEQGLQEASDFMLAADNRANIVPNPKEKDREGNGFSLMAAVTIFAFRDGGPAPEPAAAKIMKNATDHLLAKQKADGSWMRFEGRPPIFEREEAATLLAAHAVGAPKPAVKPSPQLAKARQWLAANSKGESQQALSLRILVDHDRKASVEQLLKRQNADGGWSQTKAMASDAYATGQAVYALVARGSIDKSNPAILKARAFLVKSQKEDGFWPMTSRPPNNGKSKGGAGNLEPITVAGSAWAVLGLLQCTPPVAVVRPAQLR